MDWCKIDISEFIKNYFSKNEAIEEVKKDGWSLEYIHDDLKDYDICLMAVKSTGRRISSNESILRYIPNRLLDKALCKLAIERNGEALRDVPHDLRDRELCMLAVQNYGDILYAVPDAFKDYEMCKEAILEDGYAYVSVPIHINCEELTYLAMRSAPKLLCMAPEEHRSMRVYERAYRHGGIEVSKMIPGNIKNILRGY